MKRVTSTYFRFAFFAFSALFACASVLVTPAFAQDKRYTENGPDLSLRSEARVDPSTLGMSVEIPLGGGPGRAGTNAWSTLHYQSKQWRMKYGGGWRTYTSYHTKAFPLYSENAAAGWTSSLDVPWIEYTGRDQRYDENGFPLSDDPQVENYEACYILCIHLHLADGSSHELRQSDTPQCFGITDPPPNFTGSFYSTDGSRMRFDADAGVLYLPDGGRYLFGAEQTLTRYNNVDKTARWATQYIDRNGNTLNYAFSAVTDSMGRTYNNPLANNPTAGDQIYTVPGFGAQNITYTLRWRNLADVLTAGTLSYTSNYKCLGPNQYQAVSPYLYTTSSFTHICADSLVFNPVVLAEVVLPNGQSYQFKYNIYGEIDRITYPTGGYERFRYDHVSPLGDRNVHYGQANRGVVERWVSAKGDGTDETHWTYAADYADQYGAPPYKATMTAPDGTRSDRLLYYGGSLATFGFENILEGMAYDERVYNASSQMLRRSLTEWQVSGPQPGGYSGATRDPRVGKTVNLVLDTGGNALTGTTTMSYDADLNVISTSHYDYASVDSATAQTGAIGSIPLGTVVRTEETTYLVNDTGIDSGVRQSYRNRQLLGLPTSSRIKNAGGTIVAQSAISYDEAAYPLLTYGGVTGWSDPQTSYRGNPTTVSPWLNTTGSYLPTHIQYDQCGSVRNTWDASGNQSQIEYSSTYAYAYPTLTRTPVPDSSGQHGSSTALVSTSVYDFNTGLVTSVTDPNNVTSTFEYNDTFNHLTRTVRASGTAVQNQTSVAYDYLNHLITTTTDQNSYNDGALKSQVLYDGLGRTIESRQYEGGTNYIVVQTQYDTMGRAYKTSNPFRPWQSETAVWTTSVFDALGRVLSVTTPDSAVVTSAYSGSTSAPVGTVVTVTDQAGKSRKSVTDGLGRLTTVYEDPSNLNYATSYSFDTLNNLTTVTQGSQTRTFAYDSLKRLTSASNPESGTVSYSYDSNGNLSSKTDARSITSSFTYDALNRVITRSYTNDGGVTPPVNYYYDNASLPSGAPASFNRGYATGRLVAVTYGSGSSNGDYRGYDELGRVIRQVQQTDGVNYLTEATYYLNSTMATETYPSVPGASDRRTVSYSLDSAARLSLLSSSATSYAAAASLSSISYEPHGGLGSETLGNTLIHQMSYNTRLQTTAVKLGTSGNSTSVLNLTYSYGTTDNNGNLKSHVNTIGSLAITDTFSYDSLNRLSSAVETSTAGGGWTETNGYDRYGNRWIDLGGGNQSLTFSTTTNRITTSGYSYDSAGNLNAAGGVGYGYDAENHLITFNSTTGYKYDGEGRRVRKLIGENTRFIYGISGELIAEFNGSTGNLQKEYVSGGGTMAVIDPSSGAKYTTTDHLGSPRVVTDASGNVISRHDYMPFGIEIGSGVSGRTTTLGYGASDGVRDQFTGQQRDTESGLDYFGARYYSAAQGRFTSADPLMASARPISPQSWNRYSYVLNKPMNLIDPSGLTAQSTGEGCSAEFDRCDGGESTSHAENNYAENVQHQMNATAATQAAQSGDWDTFNDLMAEDSTLVIDPQKSGNLIPDKTTNPEDYYMMAVLLGEATPRGKVGKEHQYGIDQSGKSLKEAGLPNGPLITEDTAMLEMIYMASSIINRMGASNSGNSITKIAASGEFAGFKPGLKLLENGGAPRRQLAFARAAIDFVRGIGRPAGAGGSQVPENVQFWKAVVQGNRIRPWREDIDYRRVGMTDFSTQN